MTGNDVALRPFRLQNEFGDSIVGDVRFIPGLTGQTAVIICHSFMAFKDWGFFPHVAVRFAQAGFAAVTFNFSLNGVPGDGTKIADFSRFEQNTFSRELHDLDCVAGAVRTNALGVAGLEAGKFILVGHSRGGGTAIVFASRSADVRSMVTWSAVSTFDRWTSHQKEQWRRRGFLPLAKEVSVSPLRLGVGLLDDLEQNGDRLQILAAAARLRVPWLIVHGKADVIVQPREAEALYDAADKRQTEMVLLDHAGHLFNAGSRSEDQYQTLDHLIGLTIQWLQRQPT